MWKECRNSEIKDSLAKGVLFMDSVVDISHNVLKRIQCFQVMVYWLVFVTYSSILPNYYLTFYDNVFKGSSIVNVLSSYWCIPVEENLGMLSECTPIHHGNSNPDPQSFDLQYLS